MAQSKRDENRITTLIGVSELDTTTPTLVAVDPTTNRLLVDASIDTSDIEIGAVEIKNSTDDTRATVNANGLAISSLSLNFGVNHLDDYTTTSVTYVGKEDKDGVWWIIKIDETGNFPVFTHATVTNNPTLTSYTLAWTSRVTATYNVFATAF